MVGGQELHCAVLIQPGAHYFLSREGCSELHVEIPDCLAGMRLVNSSYKQYLAHLSS